MYVDNEGKSTFYEIEFISWQR